MEQGNANLCLPAYQVVQRHLIVVGQLDEKFHRDGPGPLLVAAVDLPLTAQHIRYLLLGQVVVHPQVLDPLKLHDTTS